MAKKIEVEQSEKEISTKILAESIVQISADMKKLAQSGLNRKAIVVLLKHATGLTMIDIEKVLDGMVDLRAMYCR